MDKLADKLKERLCERFQNVVCDFRSSAPTALTSTEAGDVSLSTGDGTGPVPYVNNSSTHNSCSFVEVVREWRSLADCIALMPYSEKGLHICMENMRFYKHALGDNHVYQVFKVRNGRLLRGACMRSSSCAYGRGMLQPWKCPCYIGLG